MRDRREAGSDVRLDHPPAAPPALVDEHLQGVVRRALRAEPETARQEVRLEDRLEHDLHRGFHDTITDRRNRQRTPLARTGLGYQHPPRRQRPPPSVSQLLGNLIQEPFNAVLLDISQGGSVDTRSAAVTAHRDPRPPQDVPAIDLVSQRMKPSSRISLGRPVQRMLQGTNRVPRGPRRGGTSLIGTHRALLPDTTHERSSGPSLTGGYVVRPARSVLRPPPTPSRHPIHFPAPHRL